MNNISTSFLPSGITVGKENYNNLRIVNSILYQLKNKVRYTYLEYTKQYIKCWFDISTFVWILSQSWWKGQWKNIHDTHNSNKLYVAWSQFSLTVYYNYDSNYKWVRTFFKTLVLGLWRWFKGLENRLCSGGPGFLPA